MNNKTVVIIGAGQSGAWVAKTLRHYDPKVNILLIGQEQTMPYERPALSKGVLQGSEAAPPFLLRTTEVDEQNIEMMLGVSVISIDRFEKQVLLSTGLRVQYDRLVIATGGRARKPNIKNLELPCVYTLRTWDDALQLQKQLKNNAKILVIGGGWIGLEVAATASKMGCEITLIEAGSRLCARSIPCEISQFLLEKHISAGIDIQLNGVVHEIQRNNNGKLEVLTHSGFEQFDAVIIGIGLEPNTNLASDCGLIVENGIVVDEKGKTSDPNIYATGDVTNQPLKWAGLQASRTIRFESWANAQNQGIIVGQALANVEVNEQEIPWFWSDQLDMNIQVLGLPINNQGKKIIRGSMEDNKFCMYELFGNSINSVIAVNMAKELKLAKKWMKSGHFPNPEQLGDLNFRLDKF